MAGVNDSQETATLTKVSPCEIFREHPDRCVRLFLFYFHVFNVGINDCVG